MTCRNCKWFEPKPEMNGGKQTGLCRHNPPITLPLLVPAGASALGQPQMAIKFFTAWAEVPADNYCAHETTRLEIIQ